MFRMVRMVDRMMNGMMHHMMLLMVNRVVYRMMILCHGKSGHADKKG